MLRKFLRHVHSAITNHKCVFEIDKALCTGNYKKLMNIANIEKFESLLCNEVEASYEQYAGVASVHSALRQPNLEEQLLINHAKLIVQLEKEVEDFPEHVCCSCERLLQRKSVTVVKLSDDLGNVVWPRLKSFILERTPDVQGHILYMCNYCKHMIKGNRLPPRCVLNGLQTVPIPTELAVLDLLSRQLIQRAKCYQTIVRLDTYTGKVPIYIDWLYKDVNNESVDEATKHIIEVSNTATARMLEKASREDFRLTLYGISIISCLLLLTLNNTNC